MKEIITDFIKSLKNFHSEKFCELNREIADNTLFSFAFPVKDLNFGEIYTNIETISPSFIIEKPSRFFKVLGFYSIFSISEDFNNSTTDISGKLNLLRENLIDNWDNNLRKDIPLFLGGMKFSNSNNSNLWKDFESSNWFIPKYTFFQSKNSNFIIFNTLLNSNNNFELEMDVIQNELDTLLKVKDKNSENSNFKNDKINKNGKIEKAEWINKIDNIITLINNKEIEKVVLSRKVSLKLNNKPNWSFIREELTKNFPTCHFFNFHNNNSFFFGSTPERLAKFKNGLIEIDALAGSAPRGKDEKEDKLFEDSLLNSEKDINEHNFVIEHIKDSIKETTKNIEVKNKYSILKLNNIQHLYSKVTAEFKNGYSPFDLLSKLYPTPAICGVSKNKALSIINKYENYERGMYSGIIGWFNLANEGEYTVALRSAVTDEKELTAFAGSGIVASSDSNTEFEETEIKLKAILNLFDEKK